MQSPGNPYLFQLTLGAVIAFKPLLISAGLLFMLGVAGCVPTENNTHNRIGA
jgi:hypothetical protein